METQVSTAELIETMALVTKVHASKDLIDYVQRLLAHSRDSGLFVVGLSPRAGLGLLRAARAWALLDGRDYVSPEDIQVVLGPVTGHRLQASAGGTSQASTQQLLEAVPVVRRR
jgi:MoxR-like ATPase